MKPLIENGIQKSFNEKLLGLVEDPKLVPLLKPMDLLSLVIKAKTRI
jgi:hypothetical protein